MSSRTGQPAKKSFRLRRKPITSAAAITNSRSTQAPQLRLFRMADLFRPQLHSESRRSPRRWCNRRFPDMSTVTRRAFCGASTAGVFLISPTARAQDRFGVQNCATEWAYHSGKRYADPFNEVELDVIFTTPSGSEH